MNSFLERQGDNLANFHILPLLKLNKASFGEDNFMNAYISEKRDYIIVRVIELEDGLITAMEKHPHYVTDIEDDGKYLILFTIPEEFKKEVDKFTEGKYSEFSDTAKDLIRTYSGLKYNVKVTTSKGTAQVTHAFLRALVKDNDMRIQMEDYLGVKIDKSQELLAAPHEQNYYSL